MNRNEFRDWVQSGLTYDSTFEEKCPHCQNTIKGGVRYLDKSQSLVERILVKLGFSDLIIQEIRHDLQELILDMTVGDEIKDSEIILGILERNISVPWEVINGRQIK